MFFLQVPFPTSASFNQEVETALESFDFLNCSDLEDNDDDDVGHEVMEQKETEEVQEKQEDKEKEHNFSEGRLVSQLTVQNVLHLCYSFILLEDKYTILHQKWVKRLKIERVWKI